MKNILSRIFSILIILIVADNVYATKYDLVTFGPKFSAVSLLDRDSIIAEGKFKYAWFYTYLDDSRLLADRIKFDCATRRSALVNTARLDRKGNYLTTKEFDENFSSVLPGTMLDDEIKVVCYNKKPINSINLPDHESLYNFSEELIRRMKALK